MEEALGPTDIASEHPARISQGELTAARSNEMRIMTIDNNNFGIFRRALALTYATAFAIEPWVEILSEDQATKVLEDYLAKRGNMFRAGLDRVGRLVGATVSYPLYLNPAILAYQPDIAESAAYIAEVWVDPACHRMGYGAALLADAEVKLQARANAHAMLRTAEIDRGLQGFYAKRGYRIVGVQEGEKPCNRVVFVKTLLGDEMAGGSSKANVTQFGARTGAGTPGFGGEGG